MARKRGKRKPNQITLGIVARIERALGYMRWRQREVPDWGQIAQAAKLTPSRMSEIRSGKRRIQVPEVIGIAGRLGVRAGWLLNGEEPMEAGDTATTPQPSTDPGEENQEFYNRRATDVHRDVSIPPATPEGGRPAKHGGNQQ